MGLPSLHAYSWWRKDHNHPLLPFSRSIIGITHLWKGKQQFHVNPTAHDFSFEQLSQSYCGERYISEVFTRTVRKWWLYWADALIMQIRVIVRGEKLDEAHLCEVSWLWMIAQRYVELRRQTRKIPWVEEKKLLKSENFTIVGSEALDIFNRFQLTQAEDAT